MRRLIAPAMAVALVMAPLPVFAAITGIGDGTAWTVVNGGGAAPVFDALGGTTGTGEVQITTNANDTWNAIWWVEPGNDVQDIEQFTAQFDYQVLAGSGTPADGVGLVVQNDGTAAIGGGGGSLAYQGMGSLNAGVFLDIYGGATVGFKTGAAGSLSGHYFPDPVDLIDPGNWPNDYIRVIVDYDSFTQGLNVTLEQRDAADINNVVATWSQTFPGIDVPTIVGGSTAYVGFTGATGGENADQRVSNFTFTGGPLEYLTWDKATATEGDWTDANWLTPPPTFPDATVIARVQNDGLASVAFNLVNVTGDQAAKGLLLSDPGPDPDTGNYVWLRRTTGWSGGAPDDTFGSLTLTYKIDGGAANNFLIMDQGTSVNTGAAASQLSGMMFFGSDTHPGPDGTPETGDDVTIPIEPVIVNTPGDLTILHRLDDATFDPAEPDRKFVKQGAGTLSIDSTTAVMTTGNTIFRIEDGMLDVRGPDPLGGAPSVELAGGKIKVTGVGAVGTPAPGFIAGWTFNAGTADDLTGTYNATLEGDAAVTPDGIVGGGLEVDGSGDLARVSGGLPIAGGTDFTIAAWVKRDREADEWYFSQGDTLSGDQALHIGFRSGTRHTIGFWGDDLEYDLPAPVTGEWHHWTSVYNSSTSQQILYLDGVEVDRESCNVFNGAGDFIMGRRNDGGQWFDGTLDEAYAYTSALAPGDIATMATLVRPVDLSTVAVDVHADSGLELDATGAVPVGPLTLYEGVLALEGKAGVVQFASTDIPSGRVAPVGVNLQIEGAVDLGAIDAHGDAMTFIKRGNNLDLNPANTGLASTASLVVEDGTMTSVDTAPLGSAAVGIGLGGEFRIASSGGDLTVNNAIDGDTVDVQLVYGLEAMGTFYDVHGHASRIDPLQSGDGALTLTPDVGPKPLDTRMYWYNNDEVPNWFGGATGDDWVAVFQLPLNVGSPNLPAGDISFGTESDDGSMLFIDLNGDGIYDSSEAIVSNNGDHGRQQRTGTINLAAGTYNVAIGVYERGGGDNLVAVFGSGASLGWGSMMVIDPTDPGQAGVWDPSLPSEMRTYALLTAGIFDTMYDTASGVGEKVILANFNPDGVVGLNAIDGYSFEIPNAVNAPTGGFATLAGETVVQKALNVQYLDLGEGLFTRAGVGADRAITIAPGGSLILSDQSLDMSVDPFSLAPDSEVFIGDGQTLTMVGPFECGTLNLVGSLVFSSGLEQITVNDAFNILGADVNTVGMTLDVSTAVVTIGKDRTLTDDSPAGLVAGGLDLSEGAAIQLVGPSQSVSVDSILRLNVFTLDTTGSTLTTTANTAMELTSAAIVADQSLLADTLTMFDSTITLGGGTGSITVGTSPDLKNSTINADLKGAFDLTIDHASATGMVAINGAGGPGNRYTGDTEIIRGALAVSTDAGSLGDGNLAFNASSGDHPAVLLGSGTFDREMGPGAGQVNFLSHGGFGAKGGPFTVSLGVGGVPNGTIPLDGSVRIFLGHSEADNLTDITNPILLTADQRFELGNNTETDQDVVKLSGDISSSSDVRFHVDGNAGLGQEYPKGTLWLAGTNTFTGQLDIDEGVVRGEDGVGIPAGVYVRIDPDDRNRGAVWESWGTITRPVTNRADWGSPAPGEILFEQHVGFAAWDDGNKTFDDPSTPALECLTITLTVNGVPNGPLNWDDQIDNDGDDYFNAGSRTANAMTTLTNPLQLHDRDRDSEFHLWDNPNTDQDVFRITGVISDVQNNDTLEIDDVSGTTTGGVLWLDPRDPSTGDPVPNTFGDELDIEEGVVRAVQGFGLPTGVELNFHDGDWGEPAVFESWDQIPGDPTSGLRLGTNNSSGFDNTADWDGGGNSKGGGFAAWSGPLHVTFEPADAADAVGRVINWGNNSDGFDGRALQLNSPHANDVVTLTNPIDLAAGGDFRWGGNVRRVYVHDNPFQTTDWAVMSGRLFGATLEKHGPGRLDLTNDNQMSLTLVEGPLNTTGNNKIGDLVVNAGELNMTGDDTIDAVVINGGDVTFAGTNSLGTVDVLGGSLLATVGTALGDGSAEVTVDGAWLGLESGTSSVVGTITPSGATVYAGAGATLTLTPPAVLTVGGDVVKQGDGTVNLENHPIAGNVTVAEGTLGVGQNLLTFYLPGAETLTVGENAALGTAGSVNRRVVSTGTGAAVVANADSDIGLLSETDGWGFVGAMEIGPHTVGLKDADEAELYGAHMAGGTISSFNGIRLLPINISDGLNSRLYGFGTVNGNVVAGIQGNPTPAVVVADPGQTIEFTGVVQTGNSTFVNNVVITGTERLGFSPAVGMKLGGAPIGPDAVVEVYGTAGADFESEIPDALAPPVADPVSGYGQFYVAGGESLVSGKITLSTGGSDYVGRGGDTFELIVTGQAWLMDFTQFPPQNVLLPEGSVNIDPGFIVDTSGIPLASPGLFWQESRSEQGLTLKIVPEPGTLVLLLTGGLGLLLLVWRRRS